MKPVQNESATHAPCLAAFSPILRAESGEASSFVRALRSPSMTRSIQRKISV